MARRFFSPFSFQSAAHSLAVATIGASVLQGLLLQSGNPLLLFSPHDTIYAFQLWRPLTALFVAVSPLEVIFNALIIYSLGGLMEARLGKRGFLRVALGIPLAAECIVLLMALVMPSTFGGAYYPGTRPVITSLWIIFGLMAQFSHEMLNFWGTPIRGKTFALIGLGFVLLSGVFGSLVAVMPECVAAGLSYAYMYRPRGNRLIQKIELAYYTWKLERLKAKSKLRVVKGSRDDGSEPPIH